MLRLRGAGCAPSKAAGEGESVAANGLSAASADSLTAETEFIKLPSGGFACSASPLFKEYLGLLGSGLGEPAAVGPITSEDALLIIDMQRDFVPKSSLNADGGRFGVAEGDHLIPLCEQLIQHVRLA